VFPSTKAPLAALKPDGANAEPRFLRRLPLLAAGSTRRAGELFVDGRAAGHLRPFGRPIKRYLTPRPPSWPMSPRYRTAQRDDDLPPACQGPEPVFKRVPGDAATWSADRNREPRLPSNRYTAHPPATPRRSRAKKPKIGGPNSGRVPPPLSAGRALKNTSTRRPCVACRRPADAGGDDAETTPGPGRGAGSRSMTGPAVLAPAGQVAGRHADHPLRSNDDPNHAPPGRPPRGVRWL